MAHMIAYAVGGPAQSQLAQIPRAQNEGVVVVCQAEEMAGALPGLDIFKGDVVKGLGIGDWGLEIGGRAIRRISTIQYPKCVADVPEHLHGRGADVDLVGADAQGLHQPVGIRAGSCAGGKAGHCVGQDIRAG